MGGVAHPDRWAAVICTGFPSMSSALTFMLFVTADIYFTLKIS
jgi:uncharacterized MnhB-related membrane protein